MLVSVAGLIGLNLRAGIGSIPPLLDQIASDLGLSHTAQGLLTSVAILFIGLSAPAGQRLAARIGAERATTWVLLLLAVGLLLRLWATSLGVFLLSSAVSGIGMGGASALMPILIAHHVPRIRGFAMGVYSTGLAVGVAIAAGVAVPAENLLGGWRASLAVWGAATALTAALWALLVPRLVAELPHDRSTRLTLDHRLPWRSRTAWLVTWYTCAWMVIGFSGLAWIVPFYRERGLSPGTAAAYFIVFQLVQLVSMLILPSLTDFTSDRRPLLALTLGCGLLGVGLMLIAPERMAIPAVTLLGLGAGGGLTMALVLITDVTTTRSDGARLNALVMLVAYPLGALAPLMLGFLHDLTGSFAPGYLIVLLVAAVTLAVVPALRPGRSMSNSPLGAGAPEISGSS